MRAFVTTPMPLQSKAKHGSIDLGEEKPTRPRDGTNSSIWENRSFQSYEGRRSPTFRLVHLAHLRCRVLWVVNHFGRLHGLLTPMYFHKDLLQTSVAMYK